MLLTALHVIVDNVMLTTTLSVKNHYCSFLMKELRLRNIKEVAQGCQARQWHIWNLDPRGWL